MKRNELVQTVVNVTGLSAEVVKDVLRTAGEIVAEGVGVDYTSVDVPGFGTFDGAFVTCGGSLRRDTEVLFAPSKRFRRAARPRPYPEGV